MLHSCPQSPQFFMSRDISTQDIPQTTLGVSHTIGGGGFPLYSCATEEYSTEGGAELQAIVRSKSTKIDLMKLSIPNLIIQVTTIRNIDRRNCYYQDHEISHSWLTTYGVVQRI